MHCFYTVRVGPVMQDRMGNREQRVWCLLTGCLLGLIGPGWADSGLVHAELVRFEITARTPFAEGKSFGDAGPYELLSGTAHFALDPDLAANRAVVDLALAPRNARGLVECQADLMILAPQDPSRGNGALLYDVNNRGNKLVLGMFNGAGGNAATSAGDGFLMNHGFTIVWSGWDAELFPGDQRLRLAAPVAVGAEGPITGRVRCEFQPGVASPPRMTVTFWAQHGSYRPLSGGRAKPELTVRSNSRAPRTRLPEGAFELHVTEVPGSLLPLVEVETRTAWEPGSLYELTYDAEGPLVHGCGFTTVRDLVSALKSGRGDGNPFHSGDASRPAFARAIGFGVSQTGRFLREFVYSGFNADEAGQMVFDGLLPHVAGGGLGSFNHRFAQPTRHGGQHDHDDYPVDRFPFAYGETFDPLTGRTDGILNAAIKAGTVPRVMHTQSAGEYWTRSGSLVHTDPLGHRDLPIPDSVRIYAFGGTQHGPAGYPPMKAGVYLANPGDFRPFLRALLLRLDRWIATGEAPPPSIYPRVERGDLVSLESYRQAFPLTSRTSPLPQALRSPPAADYGPRWQSERIIEVQPPRLLGRYTSLIPKPSLEDGNDLGCLSPPEVAVPVGTYTGWNLRTAEQGAAGELVSLTGSFIPFAKTTAQATAAGDRRATLEARYPSLADYVAKLEAECQPLVEEGYLRAEDAPGIVTTQTERVRPLFSAD
jgi:hypothetical protein